MKIINSILIFALVIVVFVTGFTGCGDSVVNSNGTTKRYQARTEADFLNGNLKAEPGAVIVLDLEDLDFIPGPEWIDTDIIGVDIIPYTYTETAEHKISIGDSSFFEIALVDEALKTVIFELTPQNNNITVTIPAGDYLLIITSLIEYDSGSPASQVVFIQPDMAETLARGGDFEHINYDPSQLNTLLSTNRCIGCNLSEADLKGKNLSSSNLYMANLSHADLSYSNLSYSNLLRVNLLGANLSNANLLRVNLQGANLKWVNLYQSILRNSNLDSVNLYNANLKSTDLSNTILSSASVSYASLNSADLSYADLSFTSFWRANLANANLYYANLRDTDSYRADFTNADLSYADLSGAIFCEAIKTGIIAPGVITNSSTQCWP